MKGYLGSDDCTNNYIKAQILYDIVLSTSVTRPIGDTCN